ACSRAKTLSSLRADGAARPAPAALPPPALMLARGDADESHCEGKLSRIRSCVAWRGVAWSPALKPDQQIL
ncbi:hypothetical protein, partial [Escherichia coli]|uniref:hypothetical protein n=1 Tax=Escherichia coli TaxID=562 RepID=UPI00289D02EB